jgi:hypothetical protein
MPSFFYFLQLKIIEILLKGYNNTENFLQKVRN